MVKVYFDSNVFSNLRRNEKPQCIQLNELLNQHKHNLSFYFSYAHIRDKKKDLSEKKFNDFAFMESLTKDNYLAYDPNEKRTTSYLATPLMVYQEEEFETNDFQSLFSFLELSQDDDPILAALKQSAKSLFYQAPLDLEVDLSALPAEQKSLLDRVFGEHGLKTMGGFMDGFMNYVLELHTDHETYKELRTMIDTGINNGHITLKNREIDFNEALKGTSIQKTFLDFVKTSVQPNGNGNYPFYEFYLQAYNALDFLGISKDKITRKNNYYNLFNDGLHSYFAAHCHYLVTEDGSLSEKSKALYRMLGIETEVFSLDEFIERLPEIAKDSEHDLIEFFGKLYQNLHSGELLETKEDLTLIRPKRAYLNSFNLLLQQSLDGETSFYLFEEKAGLQSGSNYRELGMIIEKANQLFGKDVLNLGAFDFEKEVAQLREDSWQGRMWLVGSLIIHLHRNDNLHSYTLQIRPFSASDTSHKDES